MCVQEVTHRSDRGELWRSSPCFLLHPVFLCQYSKINNKTNRFLNLKKGGVFIHPKKEEKARGLLTKLGPKRDQ